MSRDMTGLPKNILSIKTLANQLDQADALMQHGGYQQALRQYRAVQSHIEDTVKQEQKSISKKAAVIGGIVGAVIPVLHIVTIPLGAYLGYQATKTSALTALADTPYFSIYQRAIDGVLNAAERIGTHD